MLVYTVHRLLLIIPTLFGIMLMNVVVLQLASGGPVEQAAADAGHARQEGARRPLSKPRDRRLTMVHKY